MAHTVHRIGLLLGSLRSNGNALGLASWMSPIIQRRLATPLGNTQIPFELVSVDQQSSPLPLGPIVDGSYMPAHIRKTSDYPLPGIREWSSFVSSCSGFVMLAPEYNGGYPGELKNAIDHIYWEWRDKPVILVTYGSHGGQSCAAQLQSVLERIKMKVTKNSVQISLPKEFIAGTERVEPGQHFPTFLAEHEHAVEAATEELMGLIETPAA